MGVLKTIDLNTTSIDFQSLVEEVQEGNEILIMQGDKPIARLVPAEQTPTKRVPNLSRGAIWVSDDFDDPLPDEFWLGEE